MVPAIRFSPVPSELPMSMQGRLGKGEAFPTLTPLFREARVGSRENLVFKEKRRSHPSLGMTRPGNDIFIMNSVG